MHRIINENENLGIIGKNGMVNNQQICVVAKSGNGKTVVTRTMQDEFFNKGYVCIYIADPKKTQEANFMRFLPEDKEHLLSLKLVGKPARITPIKHYEPFTFSTPKNKKLSDIQFFTFPIKQLGRPEFSFLLEAEADSESVGLLLKGAREITNNDGLFTFLHKIQSSIQGKKDGNKRMADPSNFFLSGTVGNMKSISEISRHFTPFKHDYMLSPENSDLNLKWRDILNDNKHVHIFNSSFVEDEKLSDFCTLTLLTQIMKNRHLSSKPVCIIIPEIRTLTPAKNEGFKSFLAANIKKQLSLCRSTGKGGVSTIACTQVFMDISENVRNSFTDVFLGALSLTDIDRISKAFSYSKPIREVLLSPDYPYSFVYVGNDEAMGHLPHMPHGMLKEERYEYFDMCKKLIPEKMKNYHDLFDIMKQSYDLEFQTFKDKTIKDRERIIQKEEEKKEGKREKGNLKAQKEIFNKRAASNKNNEEIKKALFNYLDKCDKIPANRELAEIFGFSYVTLGKWKNEWKGLQKET